MNTSGFFGTLRSCLEKYQGVLAPNDGQVVSALSRLLDLDEANTQRVICTAADKAVLQFAGPHNRDPRAIWLPPKDRNYSLVTEEEIFWRVRKWVRTLPAHDTVQVYGCKHLAALSGLPPTETAGSKAQVELAKYDAMEALAFDDERWPWEVMHVYEPVLA